MKVLLYLISFLLLSHILCFNFKCSVRFTKNVTPYLCSIEEFSLSNISFLPSVKELLTNTDFLKNKIALSLYYKLSLWDEDKDIQHRDEEVTFSRLSKFPIVEKEKALIEKALAKKRGKPIIIYHY